MLKTYADCCGFGSTHTANTLCEMIKTFPSQERDECRIIFSAWNQHFIIKVATRIMLQLCYSISAVKHYAAQRWEKWKLTLIRMMIPAYGWRQKAAFLPSSELHWWVGGRSSSWSTHSSTAQHVKSAPSFLGSKSILKKILFQWR